MLEIHIARDRAVRRAIDTGEMPNLDLIHTMQRTEGNNPCFGRVESHCHQVVCRWHGPCMKLATYSPASRTAATESTRRIPPGMPGTYRDGNTPPSH